MTWSTFHHGSLHHALVEAALASVEKYGAEAFSLRQIASDIGVTPAAAYHHFKSRDALLAAVAGRGYEELIAIYQQASSREDGPMETLAATNRAFFEFALARRRLHELMFESDFLGRPDLPEAVAVPAKTLFGLRCRAMAAAYPDLSDVDIRKKILVTISTASGYLMLDREGRLRPYMVDPLTHAEQVEVVLAALA